MVNQSELEYIKAVVRLFNSVPEVLDGLTSSDEVHISFEDIRSAETLKHGFIVSQSAVRHCPFCNSDEGIDLLTDLIGYDIFQLNQSFFESFSKSSSMTAEDTFIEQILHYFSTYGFSTLGLYQDKYVYIPMREFGTPESSEPPSVKVKVIDYISDKELIERITNLIVKSAVALSDQTVRDILTIVHYLNLDLKLDQIRNKEIRIRLTAELDKVPADPEELFRVLLFKASKNTLFIKDPLHVSYLKIYAADGGCRNLIFRYISFYGKEQLASVFYRLKPFFLALRHDVQLRPVINSIRKLAKTYHVPKTVGILDSLTSKSATLDKEVVFKELDKVSVFKKISILNAMLYRASKPEAFSYFVRNGKVFSKAVTEESYRFDFSLAVRIFEDIQKVVRPHVQGKRIYIPKELDYTCPVSEKRFVGVIPFGTSYRFKTDGLIFGVHWFNVQNESGKEVLTDLDLHVQSGCRDIGWNTYFSRTNQLCKDDKGIVFSGDMTSAPRATGGAVEAFYIGPGIVDEALLFSLNNYTFFGKACLSDVPFNLFISDESRSDIFNRNYLIDNAPLMFNVPIEIHSPNLILGVLFAGDDGAKTFYFGAAQNSELTVARYNEHSENYIKSIRSSFTSQLKLIPVLEKAGAVIEREQSDACDLSLAPSELAKDSILNLFV